MKDTLWLCTRFAIWICREGIVPSVKRNGTDLLSRSQKDRRPNTLNENISSKTHLSLQPKETKQTKQKGSTL